MAKPAPPPRVPYVAPQAKQWAPLMARLMADGWDETKLNDLFTRPDVNFDPEPMNKKLRELYKLAYRSDLTRQIQGGLMELGYTPGGVDGLAGENTGAAITAFQQVHGLAADGTPSEALLQQIQAELALPPANRLPARKTLAKAVSPRQVYKHFLRPERLAAAREFYFANQTDIQGMEKKFGVPGEVVVGNLMIETGFGSYLGKDKAFVVLSSMALCADFSNIETYLNDLPIDPERRDWLKDRAKEKGDWAYQEFKALLQYAEANKQDPLTIPGSIYGAIGICQFMPSNALKYGVAADGAGRGDLFKMTDAIYSTGHYIQGHGWNGDMVDPDRQRDAIYRYNRSTPYVNTVLAVADHLSKANNKKLAAR
ncbi:MAG: lytic murein transglycosylase [Deltaproteobacteria bacterium]|nr:lytic murein transglycosylase [Deltaproteobacteria bacterium]